MTIGVLWVIIGIYTDLGWHSRHDVDSFLTWAHGLLYSGLAFTFAVAAVVSQRNARSGYPWRSALPRGYELTLPAIALFFIGGVADGIGHTLWGFEEGFDALLSPTHQMIGAAIFLLGVGPIRSALIGRFATFSAQLPALIAFGSILALVHWGINPFFPTDAERGYAPPVTHGFTPDVITNQAILFDLQGGGLGSVLIQSLLFAAAALYIARALDARSPATRIVLLIANGLIAIAIDVTWIQTIVALIATVLAGAAGDAFLRDGVRLRASRPLQVALAAAVPFTYHAALLVLTVIMLGVWWDPIFFFGALLYSAVFGVLLGLVVTAVPVAGELSD